MTDTPCNRCGLLHDKEAACFQPVLSGTMTDTLRRFIWTKDGMVEFTDHPMQYGCGSTYILAADVDAVLAAHTDGYAGERTAWTLAPKDGEPIDLKLPVPLMRYILELDRLVGGQANALREALEATLMTRDEWKRQRAIELADDRSTGRPILYPGSIAPIEQALTDAMAFADTTKVCDLCATRYKNTRRTP